MTKLCLAGLTESEIAGMAGWSPQRVAEIRRVYVDDARVVVAIGERLHRALQTGLQTSHLQKVLSD